MCFKLFLLVLRTINLYRETLPEISCIGREKKTGMVQAGKIIGPNCILDHPGLHKQSNPSNELEFTQLPNPQSAFPAGPFCWVPLLAAEVWWMQRKESRIQKEMSEKLSS